MEFGFLLLSYIYRLQAHLLYKNPGLKKILGAALLQMGSLAHHCLHGQPPHVCTYSHALLTWVEGIATRMA